MVDAGTDKKAERPKRTRGVGTGTAESSSCASQVDSARIEEGAEEPAKLLEAVATPREPGESTRASQAERRGAGR